MDNVAGIFPLTPVQSGMLFHALQEPDDGVYVVQYTCTIRGPLDGTRFREAWSAAVSAHPALRAAFLYEGLDEPLQVIRESVELPWEFVDWSEVPPHAVESQFERYLADDRRKGLELASAPLMRAVLIRLGPDHHRFVWTYHHMVADGWSTVLLFNEVYRRYAGVELATDEGAGPSFGDFVTWLGEQSHEGSASYWSERLQGACLPTTPAFGQSSPGHSPVTESGHGRARLALTVQESEALRAFATANRLTLNTVIHGAWALTLGRCAGVTDVTYGAALAGRPAAFPGVDRTVGAFINTLPVRVRTDAEETLVPWLQELQDDLLELREHELTPLSSVARWSDAPASDLFTTILVFENAPATEDLAGVGELRVSDEEYFDQSNYPFALLAHPRAEIELHGVFRRDRFDEPQAYRVLELMVSTLRSLLTHGDARPTESAPPHGEERTLLLGPLATEQGAIESPPDVYRAILTQATSNPSGDAVVTPDGRFSYAAVLGGAERVRGELAGRGVEAGDRIGLLIPKSPEFVGAVLGVLSGGSAYVPLDPDYPDARLAQMIRDADVRTVLVTSDAEEGRLEALGVSPTNVLRMDPLPQTGEWKPAAGAQAGTDAAGPDEAYVIFTSGSTGTPKGVSVSRSNLAHSTAARGQVYGDAAETFLLLSPVGFDSSVAGLFWPLTCGGTIAIVPAAGQKDPRNLGRAIRDMKVSMTLCVPSFYRLLLEQAEADALTGLRTVIVAGEACSREVIRHHHALLPTTQLVNEYGPTECTVWSTYARLDTSSDDWDVPIGRPIPGALVRVMGPDGGLTPLGVAGELCVGGPGVTSGYVNSPEETASRFIDDPYSDPAITLYRTGDRVRMDADGVLYFLGRTDEQLKIRGYRVEPKEIEAAMHTHSEVSEAFVISHAAAPKPDDVEGLVEALAAMDPAVAEALLARIENGGATTTSEFQT